MLFRIPTYKSVSKQTTLTSFRINTCEKQGEGEESPPATNRQLPVTDRVPVAGEFARHSPLATFRLRTNVRCIRAFGASSTASRARLAGPSCRGSGEGPPGRGLRTAGRV